MKLGGSSYTPNAFGKSSKVEVQGIRPGLVATVISRTRRKCFLMDNAVLIADTQESLQNLIYDFHPKILKLIWKYKFIKKYITIG